jgi:hypothetical protein
MEMAIGGCGVAGAPAGVRAPGGPPVDHLTSRLHGLKRKALPQSSPHHSLSHRIVWCVGVAGAEVSYGVEERQGAKVPCAPGLTHTAGTGDDDEWQETSATSASLCLGRHGADEHASHPLTLTMLTILSVAPVEIPLTKSIIRATHSYFQT